MSKPIIGAIRDFILTCPLLSDGRVNVDYTGLAATEYGIDSEPIKSVVRQYVDGSAIKQFAFVFGSVESYSQDVVNNIENSGFYEDFEKWLSEQSRKGSLPDLGAGRKAKKIEAQSTGYLFEGGTETARYQIQCRLEYFEERK